MPNLTACSIKVKGPKEDFDLFMASLNMTDNTFSFRHLINFNDFHNFEMVDANVTNIKFKKVLINVDTPWNPPIDWIATIQERFPALKFYLAYTDFSLKTWGLVIIKRRKTINITYNFEKEDAAYFYMGEQVFNPDEDDYDEVRPTGKYKKFLKKWHVPHIGG